MYKQKGFTIIEVLIVLAIAALLLMAVLLVVPSVRLKIRNDQRKQEAARYVQETKECLAGSKLKKTSCDSIEELALGVTASGVYSDVIFCGSGGVTVSTGCGATVDGFPDFNFMYSNGYGYSSSTNWPFFEIRYGHSCTVSQDRSQPAKSDSIAVMVPYERFDGSSFSKCYEY